MSSLKTAIFPRLFLCSTLEILFIVNSKTKIFSQICCGNNVYETMGNNAWETCRLRKIVLEKQCKQLFMFFLDKRKIYVELVSRIKPDTLYRLDAQAYSSITIRGQQHNFAQAGHHFIVLNPKTGKCYKFYIIMPAWSAINSAI